MSEKTGKTYGLGVGIFRSSILPRVLILCLMGFAGPARAAVSTTGDVEPGNPAGWTATTNAHIGDTGNGTMSITGGSDVIDGYGYVAYDSGSTGDVTVTGNGSTWTSYALHVGWEGDGSLTIANGGYVHSPESTTIPDGIDIGYGYNSGSTSEVTVNGNGSMLESDTSLLVGCFGDATMNITNGGDVVDWYARIAQNPGGTGVVTVDGVGSTWTSNTSFTVGEKGNATLNITNGGVVENGYGYIGNGANSVSEVTVDGVGSRWTNNREPVGYTPPAEIGYLYVGWFGSATLNITNGGVVENDDSYVAHSTGSISEITVNGAGSTWTNNEYLYLGEVGAAALNIKSGGLVSVGESLVIDSDADGDAFINMTVGGMLALNGQADSSLSAFLDLIYGTDAIRYSNKYTSGWAHITSGTRNEDYTLEYLTEGDLDGYTVLTIIPEPATLSLLALGGAALLRQRRS